MAHVLAVSDVEDDVLCARLASGSLGPVDVVVSCGDLRPGYLDYVATMANAPLVYVRGNHDTDEAGYADCGGIPLDMTLERVAGLAFVGLDGSIDYREDIVGYSEAQMAARATVLAAKAKLMGGVDVLVCHTPPRGYGDMDDLPHRGFKCYNRLLKVLRPKIMLSGHVHLNYGMRKREHEHPSGARIINAYGYWYAEIGPQSLPST